MIYYARSASFSAQRSAVSRTHHTCSGGAVLGGSVALLAGQRQHGSVRGHCPFRRSRSMISASLKTRTKKSLSGKNPHAHLPIPHQDAGAAHLFAQKEILSALLVYAHHIGLPDLAEIQLHKPPLRLADADIRAVVDRALPELLRRHEESGCASPSLDPGGGVPGCR